MVKISVFYFFSTFYIFLYQINVYRYKSKIYFEVEYPLGFDDCHFHKSEKIKRRKELKVKSVKNL